MSYLTGTFKIRASLRDRGLLTTACARWSAAMRVVLAKARNRDDEFLQCIIAKEFKSGAKRLIVDKKRLHELCLDCCRGVETHLHSSSKMSLVVAAEETLGSWVGQYLDWIADGRSRPKPRFPELPHGGKSRPIRSYEERLERFGATVSLPEERAAAADLMRAPRAGFVPLYFGAATAGIDSVAHMGLVKREDGRWFALLALWPEGDKNGAPTLLASNRQDRGGLWTASRIIPEVREGGKAPRRKAKEARPPLPFKPTDRMRSAILCPLEFGQAKRLRENLFLARGVPKSAELFERDGEFFLHVAFQFSDPGQVASGNILALVRGLDTLLTYAVIDGTTGHTLQAGSIDGRDLKRAITGIAALRAKRQAKGRSTAGERKAGRIAEHHLYSAGHQVISIAREHGARIVLLKEEKGRRPVPWLKYRHFHQLRQILDQLAGEAGLSKIGEKKIYGSWRTCPECGAIEQSRSGATEEGQAVEQMGQADVMGQDCTEPGRTAGETEAIGVTGQVSGQGATRSGAQQLANGATSCQCGHQRTPGADQAKLLALDILRFARYPEKEGRVALGEFIGALPGNG